MMSGYQDPKTRKTTTDPHYEAKVRRTNALFYAMAADKAEPGPNDPQVILSFSMSWRRLVPYHGTGECRLPPVLATM